jgi:[ribosomal protein S18]-alanine N-acetyltransferase
MPISIREMKTADVPTVAAIENASFSSPWSEDSLREAIGTYGSITRVALLHGNIAGYLIAKKVADEMQLYDLAVMPEHRRRGIARKLVEELIERSRFSGVAKIFLEVRASNVAAIDLYEGLDFAETGVRKDYYNNPVEDAILMTLVI